MEEQVNRLVAKLWEQYTQLPTSKRLLIAISGIPGSGKTKLAKLVTQQLNSIYCERAPECLYTPVAALVPMDGFHYSRAQLSAMPDPVEAHARRGAAFTIDESGFLQLVQSLRKPLAPESKTIYAPSFDHAVKDPVYDDISLQPTMKIIIFEGLYLTLNTGEWKVAAELMDELWFVEVDFNTARERLIDRHLKAGICSNREEAEKRADESDLKNGRQIVESSLVVQETIRSCEDPSWVDVKLPESNTVTT